MTAEIYCAGRHRRHAVLGILMYRHVHSGACAPDAAKDNPLATISATMRAIE